MSPTIAFVLLTLPVNRLVLPPSAHPCAAIPYRPHAYRLADYDQPGARPELTLGDSYFRCQGPVSAVALSTDGSLVSGVSHAQDQSQYFVFVWKTDKRELYASLRGHEMGITSVGFFDKDTKLYSGDVQGNLLFWNLKDQRLLGRVKLPTAVSCFALSRDERRLAILCLDGSIMLYSFVGEQLSKPIKTNGVAHSVAFSPDGESLYSCDSTGSLTKWDISSRQSVGICPEVGVGVGCLTTSKRPALVVGGTKDGRVVIWESNLQYKAIIRSPGKSRIVSVSVDEDRQMVYAIDAAGSMWTVELESGKIVDEMSLARHDNVLCAAVNLIHKRVALGFGDDWAVALHKLTNGSSIGAPRGHRGLVYSVCYSPTGKLIATAGSDKTVRIWDGGTGAEIACSKIQVDEVSCVRFLDKEARVVFGYASGAVKVWELATGVVETLCEWPGGYVHDIQVIDENRIGICAGRRFVMWDVARKAPIWQFTHVKSSCYEGAVNGDRHRVAVAYSDHGIVVFEVDSGKRAVEFTDNPDVVYSVAWLPSSTNIVAGYRDGSVICWNAATGKAVSKHTPLEADIFTLVSLKGGKKVAVGGVADKVAIVDLESGKVEQDLVGHWGPVRKLAFSIHEERLAAASTDGLVYVWNVQKKP